MDGLIENVQAEYLLLHKRVRQRLDPVAFRREVFLATGSDEIADKAMANMVLKQGEHDGS